MTDWIVEWYRRRAAGGVGTIIGAAAFVAHDGRGWPNAVGIADDTYKDGWARCAEAAHRYGSLFGPQLFHAGAASRVSLLGHEPVCPSTWTREGFDPARAMSGEEIERVIEAFGAAARCSVEAGCDFVELHGAHGYLLHQFWRRDVNRRDDKWGDPHAFLCQVVRAVRAAIGATVPLLYRFSIHADDPSAPNEPVTPSSLAAFIVALEEAGVDVWDVSCWNDSRRGYFGTQTWLPDWVRKESAKPRIVAGNLLTPEEATDYLESGHAEAVALARALIVDANWMEKARQGARVNAVPKDTGELYTALRAGIDLGVQETSGAA